MKQLFTGGTLKKNKSSATKKTPEKEMVKEEELRARYNEYRASDSAPSTSASGIESKVGGICPSLNYYYFFL